MPIDLKKISSGKETRKPRVLVYGFEGIGKTGFAAGAPDPFFLDLNRGSLAYDVKRVFPDSWSETLEYVDAVERGQIKCETLVIDVLSDLEHMGNQEFFGNKTIDTYEGGYGKGSTLALTKWRELLGALERVWTKSNKGIVFVAHAQVKSFNDPSGPNFDRFTVSLRDNLAGLIKGWCDYNLFCREDVLQQKVGGDTKAITSGRRFAFTRRCPAFDAKARGTTEFPERIDLSWSAFELARSEDDARMANYRAEIDSMLTEIGDKALETQVKDYLRANPSMIVEAKSRVAARLEAKKKPAEAAGEQQVSK